MALYTCICDGSASNPPARKGLDGHIRGSFAILRMGADGKQTLIELVRIDEIPAAGFDCNSTNAELYTLASMLAWIKYHKIAEKGAVINIVQDATIPKDMLDGVAKAKNPHVQKHLIAIRKTLDYLRLLGATVNFVWCPQDVMKRSLIGH